MKPLHDFSDKLEDDLRSTEILNLIDFLGVTFTEIDNLQKLLKLSNSGCKFRYVTTANVFHIVTVYQGCSKRCYLNDAWLVLCDSRPINLLSHQTNKKLSLNRGSDLTNLLFEHVITKNDVIAVICGSYHISARLRALYPNICWSILVPEKNVSIGSSEFYRCVKFIEEHDARFHFVCLGAPLSEAICFHVTQRGSATGTALCTGAALEYLTGIKKRAPIFMQLVGMEWMHRAALEPRRLGLRYARLFFPFFALIFKEIKDRYRNGR